MSDNVKITLAVCITAIIITGMDIYFSPFHTCVRVGFTEFQCLRGPSSSISINHE